MRDPTYLKGQGGSDKSGVGSIPTQSINNLRLLEYRMKIELEANDDDLNWLFSKDGINFPYHTLQINRFDDTATDKLRRLLKVGIIQELTYSGECVTYHPSFMLTNIGKAFLKEWEK
jgi:hypothetical protein